MYIKERSVNIVFIFKDCPKCTYIFMVKRAKYRNIEFDPKSLRLHGIENKEINCATKNIKKNFKYYIL